MLLFCWPTYGIRSLRPSELCQIVPLLPYRPYSTSFLRFPCWLERGSISTAIGLDLSTSTFKKYPSFVLRSQKVNHFFLLGGLQRPSLVSHPRPRYGPQGTLCSSWAPWRPSACLDVRGKTTLDVKFRRRVLPQRFRIQTQKTGGDECRGERGCPWRRFAHRNQPTLEAKQPSKEQA